jgi:hypothetical protein
VTDRLYRHFDAAGRHLYATPGISADEIAARLAIDVGVAAIAAALKMLRRGDVEPPRGDAA